MSQPDPRLEAIVAAVLGDATHGTAAPAIVPATVPDALPAAAPAMPPATAPATAPAATAPATAPAVPPATAAHGGPPSLLPSASASTSRLAPFPPPGYRRQGCLLLKDPPETWTPAGYQALYRGDGGDGGGDGGGRDDDDDGKKPTAAVVPQPRELHPSAAVVEADAAIAAQA